MNTEGQHKNAFFTISLLWTVSVSKCLKDSVNIAPLTKQFCQFVKEYLFSKYYGHVSLSLSLLDYGEDLCDCDHASGDCLPLVCPASTLSLAWTGPLRLAVHPAELFWFHAGRYHRRGVPRWVWLPPLLSCCHVLWWAGPDSHANHSLPCQVLVPPEQCHHGCARLSFDQCNQSGLAHDAP